MDENEDKTKTRKIVIDVIDTPRGLVPTAESIKNLIEALNESFQLINDNLNKIVSYLAKIDQSVLNLSAKIGTTASKIDLLFATLTDLKVIIESFEKKIEKIGGNFKGREFKTSSEKTYDLLKNILFQKDTARENYDSVIKQFKEAMKPIEVEALDKSTAIRSILKQILIILETEPGMCLKTTKSIAISKNWESYYIDLEEMNPDSIKGFSQFIKYIIEKEDKIALAVLNSQKVIGLPNFVVNVSESIRLIDYLIKNELKLGDKIIIFQTDDIEKIDPLLLNKIRQVSI